MRICITSSNRLGLVPEWTQEGDSIAVFLGSQTPSVVRKGGVSSFFFLGNCYINGIMDGEVFKDSSLSVEQLILF